ncbi:protein translocase subunit SecD, partial [Candidatus Bathyarchaeota archaeon]
TYRFLYLLNDEVLLTGDHVEKANFGFGSGTDPRSAGKPVVNLSFDSEGSRKFGRITGGNIGRRLAIILNDRVYTAPNIKTKITSDAQITGIPTLEEAKMISIVLRAGSLPVPLNIKSERTVGPSLGEDSIRMGVMATVIGALVVALFMIVYYKAAGVIADFALILNLIALMAGMAAFRATLTLPGIAGIILTIGMAVDANVLIFERIREELKAGKTVRAAIDAGYSRAFRTIVDANITTLITAAILYNFGTGPVKGFAVTLFMGIVISMITAIVVTRFIFEFITARRQVEALSI